MRYLPPTVCLADLPAHHAQHIRQSPRRQLGRFYRYGYRAPGNIFINQLHRLLPWDNLSRSTVTDPHGLVSAFDAFTLLAHFHVGKTCEIDLEAHGEFETTSALHTYFNVGDIAKVSVSGLGDRFIDKVNDAKEDVLTDGIQTFPDRTDRVYLNPQDCSVINDEALNRIIAVGHQHHLNVVGWNPGPALSVSMGDMPDDGYKTFVCVETAYASETQKVTKEKPAHLAQSIRVAKR